MTRLEAFWRHFSRLEGESLQNPSLPMLEANASYGAAPSGPVWLSPAGAPGGYRLEAELCVVDFPEGVRAKAWVEQVPWSRAGAVAELWCRQHGALAWQSSTSRELARVLQAEPVLSAYLAFSDAGPAGAMLVSSDGFCGLWAGNQPIARALWARGRTDYAEFQVSLSASSLHDFPEARVLERWRAWVSAASA